MMPGLTVWAVAGALAGLKLWLVSDISVEIVFGPFDDSLYVERALQFLNGDGFGPYDSQTLAKYPGITFWLAAMRLLGIPFLLSVNLLYIAAGFYLFSGFLRAGVNRWVALCAITLWLFNPVTFGHEWARVVREPLGTGLLGLMAGAMLHTFVGLERRRAPWLHLGVFTLVFAFTLFLREDDRLLWGLLVLFVAALSWPLARQRSSVSRELVVFAVLTALVPAAAGKGYEFWLRSYVEHHYGLPIIHDFGEGEFPRLLAAIRSVESSKDNRMVMVPQETLQKLHSTVPEFRPVIDRLPPPGPGTWSCRMHGVCSEWSNGWMPFWVKEQADRAGKTPSLPAAQAYFRSIREQIERACEAGKLQCMPKGESLVPPMELRWTHALVEEAWALAKLTLAPDPHLARAAYLTYSVPVEVRRKFQIVTLTDYLDSDRTMSFGRQPAVTAFSIPLAVWREKISGIYQFFAVGLLLAALFALAARLWTVDSVPPLDPAARVAAVVGIYFLVRFAVLAYIAVFMGPYVPRFVFSTYAIGLFLAAPLIASALAVWRRSLRAGEST